MKVKYLLALLTGCVFASQALAQDDSSWRMARNQVKASDAGTISITSPAFNNNEKIPSKYSEYEKGPSFPLSWSGAPANTESYAIIMEDPDRKNPPIPVVHWLIWNIPAETTSLPEGVQKQEKTDTGMFQGVNTRGAMGYHGPRPPEGDGVHHYHVQIFALDNRLNLEPGENKDKVVAAMQGHVLASGELVGTYEQQTGTK